MTKKINCIRSKIDIASVPPSLRRAMFFTTTVFYDDFLLRNTGALPSTFSHAQEIIFIPLCRGFAPINRNESTTCTLPSLSDLYVTIIAATGLSVASVLCANRSMLFFDMCNIPCVKTRLITRKRKKKTNKRLAPRSTEISRRCFLRVQQRSKRKKSK